MKLSTITIIFSFSILVNFFVLPTSSFAQCILTNESRENITTDVTNVSGNRTIPISNNNLNIGYKNAASSTLTISIAFNGNNNVYKQDTIRLIGNFKVNISRGNNTLNQVVFVITSNSNIIFNTIDITNSSDIEFINYGIAKFANSFTMATNTIFINKTSASVLTFSNFENFSNNSNTTVLYSNGGIVNFSGGFQLQSENKFCLTGNTVINTTSIGNDVSSAVYVPASFSACLKYTTTATLNASLTNGPGILNISKPSSASTASNTANWGSASVHNNSAGCGTLLPVTLASFKASLSANKKVLISWITLTEQNTRSFEIERSIDGINFKTVGTVSAKVYSNESVQYNFTDEFSFVKTSYYYRLKMTDVDGSFFYSGVREINLNAVTNNFQVFATPGSQQIVATFPAAKSPSFIKITDMLGRTLKQQVIETGATQISISSSGLKNGNYFVVLNNNGNNQSVQIVL